MREALNENALFNTIAMAKEEIPQPVLVVEGDDDAFVLKRHQGDVFILPGFGGRGNVLKAANLVIDRSLMGVVFLIDADLDRVASSEYRFPPNVVASTHHDMFMDIAAVDVLLLEQIIETHMRRLTRGHSSSGITVPASRKLFSIALTLAARLAPFRLTNQRMNLGLTFSDFPFGALRELDPSDQDIADLIIHRSKTNLSNGDLLALVSTESAHLGVDPLILVGDHDLFNSLAFVLRNYGLTGVDDKRLFNSFIDAIHCPLIMRTSWYSDLNALFSGFNRVPFSCPCF